MVGRVWQLCYYTTAKVILNLTFIHRIMSGNHKVPNVSVMLLGAGTLILLISYFLPTFDARVVFSGYETVYIALIIPFEHFEGSFLSTALYKMHMFLLG